MELSRVMQDYIKAIYHLQQAQSPVANSALLEYMRRAGGGYSAAAVTDMIKKLAALNLVRYEPYQGVTLSAAGEKMALEMIRHHRLLELYLYEAMGVPWDQVHDEAEVLEHALSEALEERIADLLGDPLFDPHGAPIPARDGSMVSRPLLRLSEAPDGCPLRVAEVDDANPELLRRVAQLGLMPQTTVEILRRDPFDGPIYLRVSGVEQIIGAQIAEAVLVAV
jgi:DtxR family transcriptional regulator, Mn-dependent transcriptional regulator